MKLSPKALAALKRAEVAALSVKAAEEDGRWVTTSNGARLFISADGTARTGPGGREIPTRERYRDRIEGTQKEADREVKKADKAVDKARFEFEKAKIALETHESAFGEAKKRMISDFEDRLSEIDSRKSDLANKLKETQERIAALKAQLKKKKSLEDDLDEALAEQSKLTKDMSKLVVDAKKLTKDIEAL